MQNDQSVIDGYYSFLEEKSFPCVAAKDALNKNNIRIMVAEHIACPVNDREILNFIYSFTSHFRHSEKGFYSAAVIFKEPQAMDETMFDMFMWKRLQALKDMDRLLFGNDTRVDADPASPDFSFSLMEEAFFIVGLHPENSRPARRFTYPALVFNPHVQFEQMKTNGRYEKLKRIVRKRDVAFSGSVNPMLTDFGTASEVYQYSGRNYDSNWKCPLNSHNK